MPRRSRHYHPGDHPGGRCLYPGCGLPVKPGRVMCPAHWHGIRRKLRDAYIEARAEDPQSQACRDALAAINEEARRQAVAGQEAGAA